MDVPIVSGPVGSVGKYDVSFTGGQLLISGGVTLPEGTFSVSIAIGAKQVLDALAAAIGGAIPADVAKVVEAGLGL